MHNGRKVAYCPFHAFILNDEMMLQKKCYEKQCFHLTKLTGKKQFKRKKYKRNIKPRIKLSDLVKEINCKGQVDFDFWNANLTLADI